LLIAKAYYEKRITQTTNANYVCTLWFHVDYIFYS
jgi:hypothetical protein